MEEFRCRECGRLLIRFENVNGYLQAKCRCGSYNMVHLIHTNEEIKKLIGMVNNLTEEIKNMNKVGAGSKK